MGIVSSAWAIGGVDKAPAPSAPHQATFTKPKETKLDNGLRVIVAERPGLPLLAAELLVRSGSEIDPPDRAGTASMTGTLLTKGTEKMSAPEIAAAIESLGGTIASGASWDSATAVVAVMSDKAEPALGILADVVLHPTFKAEEIDRLKKQALDGLQVAMQQPGALAGLARPRILFGQSGYGHQSGGTIESVQAIQRDDVLKVYHESFRPNNAALILVGDVTLEKGRAFAQKFFGEWKAETSAQETRAPGAGVEKSWKPVNLVIDMPQAGQAAVSVCKPAIKRSSPDFYAGIVANAALGNGFASRLNREIRIKRGLSYGARSALEPRRNTGPFVASAQTKNESAAEVAKLMEGELKRLASEPVQGDELKSRQAMLTGNYARTMETNQGVAGEIAGLAVYELPIETLDKFVSLINAVSAADATAFSKKYFSEPGSVVIAGKAPAFIEALKKDLPDVKVIAQSDLDLNRPDLTKAR